jgi:uncharacterized membrane protein YhaH (DUF805 family)
MNYYLDVLKKYAVFSGRARRKEFWMFYLINMIVLFVLLSIDGALGIYDAGIDGALSIYDADAGVGLLSGIYLLAIILPLLGVAIRRLHDTGRSGWWLLISIIPLIGTITLLVFYCLDSAPEENQYGDNPKKITS